MSAGQGDARPRRPLKKRNVFIPADRIFRIFAAAQGKIG